MTDEVKAFELDYDFDPTPENLKEVYDKGFKGVKMDPVKLYSFNRYIGSFYNEFPEAIGLGKGIVSSPYKTALLLDPGFGSTESQTVGDCVSHGTRYAGEIDYMIDAYFGETEYQGRLATENIYGARGWAGEGADGSVLAEYVSQKGDGGFLVRKKYTSPDGRSSVDLSKYNGNLGSSWGRSGTPAWLSKIASENKALRVFLINSMEEMRDALATGFGVAVCSDYGFSSSRNSDGLAEQRGSWSHCMAWIGCDDTDAMVKKYGGTLFLVQNSWGIWNEGPRINDQPEGSFYIRPKVAKAMIDAGAAWCIASVRGYNRELVYDTVHKIRELSND